MLYHYTSLEAFLNILKSKQLWLVSSLTMDDKTDRFYGNLFCLASLLKSNHTDAKLLRSRLKAKDILDINVDTLSVNFYSASFCERHNNKKLWEDYADNFRGVCFEFNENCLFDYEGELIKEKYRPLDDEDKPRNPIVIENRKVEYGESEHLFEKILEDMKRFCAIDEDAMTNDKANLQFRNWLELMLITVAGVVKSNDFKDEEEIRLLFQDRYDDEFITAHPFYVLNEYNYAEVIKILGVSKKIEQPKKHVNLELNKIFSSILIPKVFVTADFELNDELRKALNDAGLYETEIGQVNKDEIY